MYEMLQILLSVAQYRVFGLETCCHDLYFKKLVLQTNYIIFACTSCISGKYSYTCDSGLLCTAGLLFCTGRLLFCLVHTLTNVSFEQISLVYLYHFLHSSTLISSIVAKWLQNTSVTFIIYNILSGMRCSPWLLLSFR